jgi:uncharacterized protein YkwD
MTTARRLAAGVLGCALGGCGGGDGELSERSVPPRGIDPAAVNLAPEHSCGIAAMAPALAQSLNALRARPQQCGARTFPATGALWWSDALAQAALGHSQDMADHNFFSHTGSDGRTAADRIKAAGHLGPTVGETLAAASTSVQRTLDALMHSPPHCEVLMNARLRLVGAACVHNPATTHKTYWSLNFGA